MQVVVLEGAPVDLTTMDFDLKTVLESIAGDDLSLDAQRFMTVQRLLCYILPCQLVFPLKHHTRQRPSCCINFYARKLSHVEHITLFFNYLTHMHLLGLGHRHTHQRMSMVLVDSTV